jgi:hypothetical protein
MAKNRFFTIYVNSKAPRHARTENRRCRALSHRRLHAPFSSGTWDRFGVDINGRKSVFAIYVNSKAPRHARTENRRCRALSHRRLHAPFSSGTWDRFGVDINGRKSVFCHLCQFQTPWICQDRKSAVQGPIPSPFTCGIRFWGQG